jgi:hypothetical protein
MRSEKGACQEEFIVDCMLEAAACLRVGPAPRDGPGRKGSGHEALGDGPGRRSTTTSARSENGQPAAHRITTINASEGVPLHRTAFVLLLVVAAHVDPLLRFRTQCPDDGTSGRQPTVGRSLVSPVSAQRQATGGFATVSCRNAQLTDRSSASMLHRAARPQQ